MIRKSKIQEKGKRLTWKDEKKERNEKKKQEKRDEK